MANKEWSCNFCETLNKKKRFLCRNCGHHKYDHKKKPEVNNNDIGIHPEVAPILRELLSLKKKG